MSTRTPGIPEENTQTQVDLGDDLLKTRTLMRPIEERNPAPVESPDELLVNAKILIGEGLLDEAKAVLRKILLVDSANAGAQEKLAEIQKLEIKQILNTDGPRSRRSYRPKGKNADDVFDPEQVLASLEKDIGMPDVDTEPFGDAAERSAFVASIEAQYQQATAQDRIDLGIGFMEMGLFKLAIEQFLVASRDPMTEKKAIALGAYTKILSGRAFDALLDLDPLVADASVSPEGKLDYGYLVARAYEALTRYDQAAIWYRGVLQIDSQYRDSQERLKKCERILSSSSP